MKREIPLIGLVLVLALLLIIPIFQVISTHAFVCNISTVLSNVGGCYVYINLKISSSLPWWLGCPSVRSQGFFITENGVVGSLSVLETANGRLVTNFNVYPYERTDVLTSVFRLYGYILVSGNLANHYINPLSYTGFGFVLPGYGDVAFYCLSHPPKSLYYLASPVNEYYISCICSARDPWCTYLGDVMQSFFGFKVPLDDIFYYILSPSLFCGSPIVISSLSSIITKCGCMYFHETVYSIRHAYIVYARSTLTWLFYGYLGCLYVYSYVCCCYKPLTVTTLTYTVYFGTNKYVEKFCLIGFHLTCLPTKTISCSFILPPCPYLCMCRLLDTRTVYTVVYSSGIVAVSTLPLWFPGIFATVTSYCGTFTAITYTRYGGILVNYLPYCTEYILNFQLCYTNPCIRAFIC